MPLAAGTRLGPYEFLAPLGAGGMGEVYRARDTRIGREVAVKVLPAGFVTDPDRLRRFEQEARAAAALNHPNILVLHDVGTHDGTPYLVTELLEGETLHERLSHGALSPRKAIDIALQIARGLAAAHERGLVHRDLKPGNVFVLRDGRVKILDFGLAKLTRPDDSERGATRAGPTATVDTDKSVVMGTAGYMAPEQVRGQPADHRADIFAFGAILYEMLSGRRAFRGETSAETMTAILREEPPDLERDGKPLPPALDRIVRHCLEKSPHERFQSASDIGFALEALSGLSDSGPKAPMVAHRGGWKRWILPGIGILGILLAGALLGRMLAPRAAEAPARYQSLTFRRGSVHQARFSGDGNTVYYSAGWEGEEPGIYSCHPGTPGELTVTAPPRSFFLAVSPSNELAILVRYAIRPHGTGLGTLARMAPGGAPRELLDNVTEADWSPDGSNLAVIHVVGNRYRVEYPIGTVLHESTGWVTHLRIAPDGKRVAFIDHPVFPDDRGAVKVVTGPGSARALTPGYASAQGLAWSPQGREIWYCAATVGVSRSVFAVPASGGPVRVVASLPNMARIQDLTANGQVLLAVESIRSGIMARGPGQDKERDLSWLDWSVAATLSDDGKTLLFDEEGEGAGEHYAVCVRGTDGSPPIRLGEGAAGDLSPDGKWVLSERYWTTPPELVLLPIGAGEPRALPPTGLDQIGDVQFFPSGTQVLVTGNEKDRPPRSYILSMEGGPLRPLTPEGVVAPPDAISPDGKWVIGGVRGSGGSLYPVDGGTPRPIAGKESTELVTGWSRDGKYIYVLAPMSGGSREVMRLDPATGSRRPWLVLKGPEGLGRVMVNVTAMARDDHSYAYSYSRANSDLYLVRGLR